MALCFTATLIMYLERVGFSIAYTSMASAAGVDEKGKGFIMSCFFYGYGMTQVRMGNAGRPTRSLLTFLSFHAAARGHLRSALRGPGYAATLLPHLVLGNPAPGENKA